MKLKNCPFCGLKPVEPVLEGEFWCMGCGRCSIMMERFSSKKELIKAWNTRCDDHTKAVDKGRCDKMFWQYWMERWPSAACNKKTLQLSANFRETKAAFFAGINAALFDTGDEQ